MIIPDPTQFLLGECSQFPPAFGVALGVKYIAVRMFRGRGFGGAVLDVADDHVVASVWEFGGIGVSDAAGGAGDDHSSVGHGKQRRSGFGRRR